MDPTLKRRQFIDMVGASMAALAVASVASTACGPVPSGMGSGGAPSEDPGDAGDEDKPDPPGEHIAMLLYPGMTMLDFIGPHTCFFALGMTVHLVSKDLNPIKADTGVSVLPTTTFAQCPKNLQILFCPGSTLGTGPAIRDPAVLQFVRSRGERAQLVTSVCTGSLILGAAGLLRGYKATSHWLTRDLLSIVEAEPVKARYVEDRNRITGAGVTAGIDFGLRIVERLRGIDKAEFMQLLIEYDPEPPFQAGSPETAPAAIVGSLQTIFSPLILDGRVALEQARASF